MLILCYLLIAIGGICLSSLLLFLLASLVQSLIEYWEFGAPQDKIACVFLIIFAIGLSSLVGGLKLLETANTDIEVERH